MYNPAKGDGLKWQDKSCHFNPSPLAGLATFDFTAYNIKIICYIFRGEILWQKY